MTLPEHHFLKTVIEAFKNDVPKKDFSNLSKTTIQQARKDLHKLLEAIPGANLENVKLLRAQLSIAEMGNWSSLKERNIEDAVSEYESLLIAKAEQDKSKNTEEPNKRFKASPATVTQEYNIKNTDVQNDENDVPEPRLKHVDTAELLLKKKEQDEKENPDNEDVPMPTLKRVDTAELFRRSKDAESKLYEGNPSIADLSDVNRPTRLAEMFSQLYDNEWTDALEYLMRMNSGERQAIEQLLHYLEAAFQYCEEEVSKLKLRLNEEVSEQSVTERLKNVTDDQMNDLQQTIGDKVIGDDKNQIVRVYIDECVRLTYLMNVQNPPMKLYKPDCGTKFNSNSFKEYTRTGHKVEYIVWPALLLHDNGPVALKGVVQVT